MKFSDTIWFSDIVYAQITCGCNFKVARIPLMQAFYAKLYDFYKIANDLKRNALDKYFRGEHINSMIPRLIGGNITWWECRDSALVSPPILLNNISLQNLTSFKNGLKTFLQKNRLNGHFFRYFIATDTLRFQWWRGHLCVSSLGNIDLIQWLLFIFVMYMLQ